VPIYEYACGDCGSRFERYVRAWGEAATCPKCQSQAVEKQLSTFAMARGRGDGGDHGAGRAGGACCGGSCGCAH
jgi:putative FmdB family regulatory protein